MVYGEVVTLIPKEERGVFETASSTGTEVYCGVRSVKMNEFYRAKEEGIEPELVIVIPHHLDYNGEQFLEYDGAKYRIIRSYVSGMTCELTVERYPK